MVDRLELIPIMRRKRNQGQNVWPKIAVPTSDRKSKTPRERERRRENNTIEEALQRVIFDI